MKLDNEFYAEVLQVANEELKRIDETYNPLETNQQKAYAQAISAATVVCYHLKLSEELIKHGIDIQLENDDDDL